MAYTWRDQQIRQWTSNSFFRVWRCLLDDFSFCCYNLISSSGQLNRYHSRTSSIRRDLHTGTSHIAATADGTWDQTVGFVAVGCRSSAVAAGRSRAPCWRLHTHLKKRTVSQSRSQLDMAECLLDSNNTWWPPDRLRVSAVLQHRTQWHDLIEHHCPRFGQTRVVSCWPPHSPPLPDR